MSPSKFIERGYEIDPTPESLPSGRFAARATLTRQSDRRTYEIQPEFEPFATESEAVSAAHMAAVAWIAHQGT
jgi:hypothetical protein